jgi:hypothetical protein
VLCVFDLCGLWFAVVCVLFDLWFMVCEEQEGSRQRRQEKKWG